MNNSTIECSFCDGPPGRDQPMLVGPDIGICKQCGSAENHNPATATAVSCSLCRKYHYKVRQSLRSPDVNVCEQCIAKLFKKEWKRTATEPQPRCSFCQKSQEAVDKLIASSLKDQPTVFICSQCVARFAEKRP